MNFINEAMLHLQTNRKENIKVTITLVTKPHLTTSDTFTATATILYLLYYSMCII